MAKLLPGIALASSTDQDDDDDDDDEDDDDVELLTTGIKTLTKT